LSYAQERLWFLWQMEPKSAAYNMAAAVRLEGKLDQEALEWSFGELEKRHESLRTRFVNEGGEGRQVIEEARGITM